MAWTHSDNYNLLPNLYVRNVFKDDVFKWYEIYPCEGYVLRIYSLDDNYVDENGEPYIESYRTWGGAMVLNQNYDWTTNPDGYTAELYDESMTVHGTDPSHEVI